MRQEALKLVGWQKLANEQRYVAASRNRWQRLYRAARAAWRCARIAKSR